MIGKLIYLFEGKEDICEGRRKLTCHREKELEELPATGTDGLIGLKQKKAYTQEQLSEEFGHYSKKFQNWEKWVKEDLFEAILGAIALDSNWDLEALQDSICY